VQRAKLPFPRGKSKTIGAKTVKKSGVWYKGFWTEGKKGVKKVLESVAAGRQAPAAAADGVKTSNRCLVRQVGCATKSTSRQKNHVL